MHKSGINGHEIPAGSLITFLQKGLQYLELESNLNEVSGSVSGHACTAVNNNLVSPLMD